MVGHTFEYNSAVHALKKYIDSGELGDIYYLDAARLNLRFVSAQFQCVVGSGSS